MGALSLLMSLTLILTLRRSQHTRPPSARYFIVVVATIGASQAVLFLAAALVLLKPILGITAAERALLLLVLSAMQIGLWLLGFRHLKRHPSQQQDALKAPGKTAV